MNWNEPQELNIQNWTDAFWNLEATDWMLSLFYNIARKYQNCQIGEIGVRGGTSSVALLLAADKMDGHVYSMDIDPCAQARMFIRDVGLSHRHTFMQGDSKTLDFPVGLDVLFIDGDHSYDGVKGDYTRHINSMKDGGVVFFHDTCSVPDVGRFVKEIGGVDIQLGAGLGIKVVSPNWFEYRPMEWVDPFAGRDDSVVVPAEVRTFARA